MIIPIDIEDTYVRIRNKMGKVYVGKVYAVSYDKDVEGNLTDTVYLKIPGIGIIPIWMDEIVNIDYLGKGELAETLYG